MALAVFADRLVPYRHSLTFKSLVGDITSNLLQQLDVSKLAFFPTVSDQALDCRTF